MQVDLAILGAGPAGAALALMLAPRHRVVLIDREAVPRPRIGESLIPAARRLLSDMRILGAFEQMGHAPYFGNRSHWGGAGVQETDFLRDPDGPGWHLDRRGFEVFLRQAAVTRGARLVTPARLRRVQRSGDVWSLDVTGAPPIAARLLVDAGGRSAPLARRLGAARIRGDRLISCWVRGTSAREDPTSAGFSLVESAPGGWWYTAPLARGGRVLALQTDPDLAPASRRLVEMACDLPGIGPVLARTGFEAITAPERTAAHSAHLEPAHGPGWLAVGDAALSFDPLSSRGLFNALYTAMTGAMACDEALSGIAADFAAYGGDLARIRASYTRHLELVYGAERRWATHLFWARRQPRLARSA